MWFLNKFKELDFNGNFHRGWGRMTTHTGNDRTDRAMEMDCIIRIWVIRHCQQGNYRAPSSIRAADYFETTPKESFHAKKNQIQVIIFCIPEKFQELKVEPNHQHDFAPESTETSEANKLGRNQNSSIFANTFIREWLCRPVISLLRVLSHMNIVVIVHRKTGWLYARNQVTWNWRFCPNKAYTIHVCNNTRTQTDFSRDQHHIWIIMLRNENMYT